MEAKDTRYQYILFKAGDIQDLQVLEAATDPAILDAMPAPARQPLAYPLVQQ